MCVFCFVSLCGNFYSQCVKQVFRFSTECLVFFSFLRSRRLLVRKKNFTQNNNNNTKVKSSLNCGVLLIKTTKEVR